MKLEISRKEFLRSWQLVENFEDVKKPNGIFVAVSENGNVTLKATDFKMSVNCIAEGVNVLEAGQAVLPATVFGSMLRKSASDDLLLSVNSSKGFLKSGSNKTRFTVVPVENFPNLPLITNGKGVCEISSEAFNKLVFEATSAASQPASGDGGYDPPADGREP